MEEVTADSGYCNGCRYKAKCLYKYDAEKDVEKNKVMKINEQWEALKEDAHANIQSEKGILNRQLLRFLRQNEAFSATKQNQTYNNSLFFR